MLTIELIGPKALTFIDYAGWLKTDEGELHLNKHYFPQCNTHYIKLDILDRAQTHLSQTCNKHMFVRPEKPDPADYQYDEPPEYGGKISFGDGGYSDALHQYENWSPMFKGEWRVIDSRIRKEWGELQLKINGKWRSISLMNGSLDNLIRKCTKQGIELFYHPEHELQ